ncbi:NfeD family protein [Massilia glaciei]|uniref:NfeD family protein n=1 Tax=Massilia glaciei TaxID=1524097 RepID=A0A2U2HME0_9BURK|nr:NfeD family protein [Massilia glaciei]PWF48670.1 NfeD family protein [Massilia glaciei]
MDDWMRWLVVAGVLVVLELFSGTFYLLMIAIGLGFGAIAALLGMSVPVQVMVAAVVGVVATELLRRSRPPMAVNSESARDPNLNIDIGQTLVVEAWQDRQARVMYRGAPWDVELAKGAADGAGTFRIVEVHGSRLVVAPA